MQPNLPSRRLIDYDRDERPPRSTRPIIEIRNIASFKDFNAADQVIENLNNARRLFAELSNDSDTSASAVVSAVGQVTSILKELTKMQGEIYNQERVKHMEEALIRVLQRFPSDLQDQFLEEFTQELTP